MAGHGEYQGPSVQVKSVPIPATTNKVLPLLSFWELEGKVTSADAVSVVAWHSEQEVMRCELQGPQ